MTKEEAIRHIRELTPKLRAAQREFQERRVQAGVKPGEPLLGLFEESPEDNGKRS